MNTNDIQKALSSDLIVKFGGVMARDKFLNVTQPGLYVVNTDYSFQPGEHWVAIALNHNSSSTYFDSYGFPPTMYPDIYNTIVANTKNGKILWNKIRLQGPLSTVCGDYCVLFCLLYARGWSSQDFSSRMVKIPDAESRDHAVRALTLDLYKYFYSPRGEGLDGVHTDSSVGVVIASS